MAAGEGRSLPCLRHIVNPVEPLDAATAGTAGAASARSTTRGHSLAAGYLAVVPPAGLLPRSRTNALHGKDTRQLHWNPRVRAGKVLPRCAACCSEQESAGSVYTYTLGVSASYIRSNAYVQPSLSRCRRAPVQGLVDRFFFLSQLFDLDCTPPVRPRPEGAASSCNWLPELATGAGARSWFLSSGALSSHRASQKSAPGCIVGCEWRALGPRSDWRTGLTADAPEWSFLHLHHACPAHVRKEQAVATYFRTPSTLARQARLLSPAGHACP